MSYKSQLIQTMEEAAFKAGRRLVRDYSELEHLQVSVKSCGSFVTSADLKAEEKIVEILTSFKPKYGILSEEREEIIGQDINHRWVIDPLDGTKNFMHALPEFCISIALEEKISGGKWKTIAGLIYAPIYEEIYWAEKGKGAFVNNRKLKTSNRKDIKESILAGDLGKDGKGTKLAKKLDFSFRILGSAALELAYIAAGKLDGVFHRALKPWDISAGILLIKEAKGVVTDIDGGEEIYKKSNILASNQNLHSDFLKLMKESFS